MNNTAIIMAKMAITIQSPKKMIIRKTASTKLGRLAPMVAKSTLM